MLSRGWDVFGVRRHVRMRLEEPSNLYRYIQSGIDALTISFSIASWRFLASDLWSRAETLFIRTLHKSGSIGSIASLKN